MQINIDNINYKFIPSNIKSFNSIKNKKLLLKNDIYEKYEATAEIQCELIICNDTNMCKKSEKKIIRETYEQYLSILEKRDIKKDIWIYNIINGFSEQDNLLYRDDKCIVIPTYTWDNKNIEKLHILCLPIDTTLRSIRSLNSSHINLLEHMKNITLNIIKKYYSLDIYYIKMFFHYEPSTYHLHIHFVNIANNDCRSSIEYSHELNNVIFNLSLCSDYYKIVTLNKRV